MTGRHQPRPTPRALHLCLRPLYHEYPAPRAAAGTACPVTGPGRDNSITHTGQATLRDGSRTTKEGQQP